MSAITITIKGEIPDGLSYPMGMATDMMYDLVDWIAVYDMPEEELERRLPLQRQFVYYLPDGQALVEVVIDDPLREAQSHAKANDHSTRS